MNYFWSGLDSKFGHTHCFVIRSRFEFWIYTKQPIMHTLAPNRKFWVFDSMNFIPVQFVNIWRSHKWVQRSHPFSGMALISTNHKGWKHWNIALQIRIFLFIIFKIFCVSFYGYWFDSTEKIPSMVWDEIGFYLGNCEKWRRFNATIVPLIQKNIRYGKLFQQSKIAFLTLIFEKFFCICCLRDIFRLHFLVQSLPKLGCIQLTKLNLWWSPESVPHSISIKQPFFEIFIAWSSPQLCCSKFSHFNVELFLSDFE